MTSLVPDMALMVERFNREIVGLPIPNEPERLRPERKAWALTAMREELDEFETTDSIDDEADALIDLTYFALGRLIEMGIAPRPIFEEVHAANMRKKRGELSKRPGSLGFDAVKPEGWTPPDLLPFLTVRREDLHQLQLIREGGERLQRVLQQMAPHDQEPFTPKAMAEPVALPKIVVLGHGRHGKDTVCEMLRDLYGFRFTSSSRFCAERVVYPALADKYNYMDAEACYEDRANHRSEWYELIRDFNRPDPTKLGRAIFAENDVYCGLRHHTEFHALFNAGVPDLVLWVDASDRVEPEPRSSCSVEPWMANFVIDNNGTVEDLERNVRSLMDNLMGEG
ncbi:hypothetical protein ELZ19_06955 [Brucella abortus]|uniref:hypothetical protein n=1 Tax=Brucella abortus TaxID=235 RepID=UPI0005C7DE16|nr:hypothetical protein [Brucella abortus]RUQ67309.1 hypothetical protein ELZ23_15385 [Brucella abortus]RUQ78560.1 hypothetical protein ELZ22_16940 [Brucella abortus]RUQ88302.1 hypothetical protein ELZ18_15695 [Brucella abortus]RUQ90332.1 hypothetical protein ELZ20_15695 [Brucella abortus]RUQ96496.1 hypothetical protein ELZ21_15390 [Brucella abortus]